MISAGQKSRTESRMTLPCADRLLSQDRTVFFSPQISGMVLFLSRVVLDHRRFRKRWRRLQILQFCGDDRRISSMHVLIRPDSRFISRESPQNCKICGRRHLLRNRLLYQLYVCHDNHNSFVYNSPHLFWWIGFGNNSPVPDLRSRAPDT